MISSLYKIEREVLYNEMARVFDLLQTTRYAIVKGEVLSQQIYGVPDKRRSSDIDIIIEKNNVKLIEGYLRDLGFNQKGSDEKIESRRNRILCMSYSHQIPSYYKEKYGFYLNVDVNYDIFWGEYEGQRLPMDEFLDDTVSMKVYDVTVKTLPIKKAFIQLILHHYKEMNSLFHLSQHNTIETDMFSDVIGLLLNNNSVLTCECVSELCERYSIGAYVYYMLYYTNLVFHDRRLVEYIERIEMYRKESIMDSFGLSEDERKKWLIPFDKRLDNRELPIHVQSQLLDSDRDKIILNKDIFQ